jgi:release factor glutamine methyltransferase
MATVDALLGQARHRGVDRLDAQSLLAHALKQTRTWLLAHGEESASEAQIAAFTQQLAQRASGVPLAYLLGQREFYGLMLRVGPQVLDPRPDTEVLVDWALAILRKRGVEPAPRVLDLGTGSGAIALALKAEWPAAEITATDVSAEALALARSNGERLGLELSWRLGPWYAALPGERFDVIVSNPPYLAENDPHLPALQAEPRQALVAGPGGLEALCSIAQGATRHLEPGGVLLLEHGADQSSKVALLLDRFGFVDIEHRCDLAGHVRCTGGHAVRP